MSIPHIYHSINRDADSNYDASNLPDCTPNPSQEIAYAFTLIFNFIISPTVPNNCKMDKLPYNSTDFVQYFYFEKYSLL